METVIYEVLLLFTLTTLGVIVASKQTLGRRFSRSHLPGLLLLGSLFSVVRYCNNIEADEIIRDFIDNAITVGTPEYEYGIFIMLILLMLYSVILSVSFTRSKQYGKAN